MKWMTRDLVLAVGIVAALATDAVADVELFRVRHLAVYDSAGKLVGAVTPNRAGDVYNGFANRDAPTVGFSLDSGGVATVRVTRSSIRANIGVRFREADCSGQAYVVYGGGDVGGPRRTVYIRTGATDRAGPLDYALGPEGCVRARTAWDAAPAAPTAVHLADYFTPPFVLRVVRGDRVERIPAEASRSAAPASADAGAEATSLFRVGPPVAYDARGVRLGRVAPDREAVAFVTGTGDVIVLGLLPQRGGYDSRTELRYEQPGCLGTPYITPRYGSRTRPLAPRAWVGGARQTVWLQRSTGRTRTFESVWNDGMQRCEDRRATVWGARAQATEVHLAEYFTPPFTVERAIRAELERR